MGDKTGIAWTDHTHNEWIGCQRVSPACGGAAGVGGCYAEVSTPARVHRARGLELWGPPKTTARHLTSEDNRRKPFAWDRAAKRDGVRRRVFCSSLSDVFEDHPSLDAWRADLWRTVEACDGLDWQLLTKRPGNVRAMVPPAWLAPGGWPAHVWVGTTVEDQKRADERIPHLLAVPARVRFLSCEPLLEAVDLREHLMGYVDDDVSGGRYVRLPHVTPYIHQDVKVSWVIVGGESGPGARPFDLAWARGIVAQCREAGVACFVKQMGDNAVVSVHDHLRAGGSLRFCARAGQNPDEWPDDLQVREFPRAVFA